MDTLHVRLSTPADVPFIRELTLATAGDNISSQRPAPLARAVESCERLLQIIGENSHVAFVAEWDGVPAGFIILLDKLPDDVTGLSQAFIAYTAVVADLRRRGIGKALLQAAEDEARRLQLSHISLMVTDDNRRACTLYLSVGYETERRLLCKTL